MSRGKLFGILIVATLLGVGGIVIRAELVGHPGVSNTITVSTPAKDQAAQQAEQKSEQQAIDSACAALRKMGGANKNCPPPSK